MSKKALDSARQLLQDCEITFRGSPVGLEATCTSGAPSAANYRECFVRDFAVAALVFLAEGRTRIVQDFLKTVLILREQELDVVGFEVQPGVLPASFQVLRSSDGHDRIIADFGDRAIGRVAPVDSMMWWMIVLNAYVRATGDVELLESRECQDTLHMILRLCLQGSFEIFPTLLVPDASFMIDRRLGVDGHPLEIQTLFYAMLQTVTGLFRRHDEAGEQYDRAAKRERSLRDYVRRFYWIDRPRLEEIRSNREEQYGRNVRNMLNIYPEAIPGWVDTWIPEGGGYFAGNLGSSRLDARFYAQGNLLAVVFGLSTRRQTDALMTLYERNWAELVGEVPARICHPALEKSEWRLMTGCDPKNRPWRYHNAGSWPVLLWPLVAAAVRAGRRDLAERAYESAVRRVAAEGWPEYYDGKTALRIGARANLRQMWSAAAVLLARHLLDDPTLLRLLPRNATRG